MDIKETAVALHRELHARGLELREDNGRDNALQEELARRLKLPSGGFTSALEASSLTAEDYLRELLVVAQPFAQMFQQIWAYLARHCAPQATEVVRIRFGFDNDKKTVIDLDQFRVMVESTRRIWSSGPMLLRPGESLFALGRILSVNLTNRRYPRYEVGKPLTLAPIVVRHPLDDLGKRVHQVLQSLIDSIAEVWPIDLQESKVSSGSCV